MSIGPVATPSTASFFHHPFLSPPPPPPPHLKIVFINPHLKCCIQWRIHNLLLGGAKILSRPILPKLKSQKKLLPWGKEREIWN